MSYDAIAHARSQVAYALRALDDAEEHHQRVEAWARRVVAKLDRSDPDKHEGEILFAVQYPEGGE